MERYLGILALVEFAVMCFLVIYFTRAHKKGGSIPLQIPIPIKDTNPMRTKFKEYLETKLDAARTNLMFQDSFQPLFITWGESGLIGEFPLKLSEESKEEEEEIKRAACKAPGVLMCAVVFDSYTYTTDTDTANDMEKNAVDLKDVEGVCDTVYVFLYTKGQVHNKMLPYKKRGEQDYWFGDSGWAAIPNLDGKFKNPLAI
jgi:hypothetical protein